MHGNSTLYKVDAFNISSQADRMSLREIFPPIVLIHLTSQVFIIPGYSILKTADIKHIDTKIPKPRQNRHSSHTSAAPQSQTKTTAVRNHRPVDIGQQPIRGS